MLLSRGLPVDLNAATAEDFRALPNIGVGLARRLVEGRVARPYCSVDDLNRVTGLGPRRVAALAPHVTVAPDACDAQTR